MHSALTMLAFMAICAAHRGSAQQASSSDPVRAATFAPSLKIAIDSARRLESGAYVLDLTVGSGAAFDAERSVTLQFAVSLPNGTQVQALTPPAEFSLGNGVLLQGVELAMAGMKVGGRRRVILPPSLGYGDQPTGPIPANSVLIVDVTLVAQGAGSR